MRLLILLAAAAVSGCTALGIGPPSSDDPISAKLPPNSRTAECPDGYALRRRNGEYVCERP